MLILLFAISFSGHPQAAKSIPSDFHFEFNLQHLKGDQYQIQISAKMDNVEAIVLQDKTQHIDLVSIVSKELLSQRTVVDSVYFGGPIAEVNFPSSLMSEAQPTIAFEHDFDGTEELQAFIVYEDGTFTPVNFKTNCFEFDFKITFSSSQSRCSGIEASMVCENCGPDPITKCCPTAWSAITACFDCTYCRICCGPCSLAPDFPCQEL
jgi:hypothetical protein